MNTIQSIPNGRSIEKPVIELENLAVIADNHAFEIWGEEVARGDPLPINNLAGVVIAYAFPFAIGQRIFPDREAVKAQAAGEHPSFGTIFIAAFPSEHPVIRVLHRLHPWFTHQEQALARGRTALAPNAEICRIVWIGMQEEYYEITAMDQRIFINVQTLEERAPDQVRDTISTILDINRDMLDTLEITHTPWITDIGPLVVVLTPVVKLIPMVDCVPVINWTWWCVPTSNAMVIGYYDNFVKGIGGIHGYGRLIGYWFDHPISGHNVPDYIDQLIDPTTGTWRTGFKDFPDFINKTYGYTFTDLEVKADSTNDWAWDQIKAEIDSGRPFLWAVSDINHSTCAVGYRISTYGGKRVILNTTWGDTVGEQREEWDYTRGDGMRFIRPGGADFGQDVALWKPDGGETLLTNIPYRVEWFIWGNRIKTAELSFSIDGGNTWTLIVHQAPCITGWNIYDWSPTLITDRARFRIRCFDNNGAYIAGDGSQKNFLINTGPRPVTLKTILVKTSTDSNGFFSAPHGLERYTPDGYKIHAISVAIQHTNGNWHTLEFSNNVDNRFWWNNDVVEGVINSPAFHNRPVKIIIFAESVPG